MTKIDGYTTKKQEEREIVEGLLIDLSKGGEGYSLKMGSFEDGRNTVHYIKILKREHTYLIFNIFGCQLLIPHPTEVPVFAVDTFIEREGEKLTERLGRNINTIANQRFYYVDSGLNIPPNVTQRLNELGLRQARNSHYYQ